jgi:O-succinylbenzoic acid--CoA ligase
VQSILLFGKEGDEFEKSIGDFLLDWFDDKSYIDLQTSGTTGIPKMIRTDKQMMVNSALATGDFFLSPGDKALILFAHEIHCWKNDAGS